MLRLEEWVEAEHGTRGLWKESLEKRALKFDDKATSEEKNRSCAFTSGFCMFLAGFKGLQNGVLLGWF